MHGTRAPAHAVCVLSVWFIWRDGGRGLCGARV